MKLLNSLLRPKNRHNLVVVVLMMLYILFDVKTPKPLASLFDSVLGNVVVAGFAISLFMRGHTVVGVLGLVAAYVFVKRASVATGSDAQRKFLPTEQKKNQQFSAFNQFPVTLEEEVVNSMQPLSTHSPATNAEYKPTLDSAGQATTL